MVNRGVIGTWNRLLLAPLAKCPGPWRVPPMLVPMYRSVMGPEWMSTWWRSILMWAGEAVLVWWRKICWGRGAPVDRDPSVALIWTDAVERPAVDDAVDVEAASPAGTDAWGWSTATYKQNQEWASAHLSKWETGIIQYSQYERAHCWQIFRSFESRRAWKLASNNKPVCGYRTAVDAGPKAKRNKWISKCHLFLTINKKKIPVRSDWSIRCLRE